MRAILFDLDGTLIDSEPVWGAANTSLVHSRQGRVTEELLRSLSGLDSTLAMRYIHEQFGWVGHDIAADVAAVQQKVSQSYARGVLWLPGARELLTAVKAAGFRTGLVTSTYRELVAYVLAEAGSDAFDVVVCGDDGHRPKPDPESYAVAAARLGVPTGACVAVEDSARGVESAAAAGCLVLNVSSTVRSPLAHVHVASLRDVDVATFERLVGSPATV
ncbi:HAD-IA family hydrolase [Dactylosporangium roseum]|uniref:HAD-IA family hydrolase n=1 Tax=Dactylosporangium roseum TaxID=47989 RepID=A0ABY5Z6X6_9ACTN|nr:HAD-IA family hydrolase [Dactylosporangium roseum]UWZ36483.1 HAD-IA family hydrolase [Dactylosporangium roseum]